MNRDVLVLFCLTEPFLPRVCWLHCSGIFLCFLSDLYLPLFLCLSLSPRLSPSPAACRLLCEVAFSGFWAPYFPPFCFCIDTHACCSVWRAVALIHSSFQTQTRFSRGGWIKVAVDWLPALLLVLVLWNKCAAYVEVACFAGTLRAARKLMFPLPSSGLFAEQVRVCCSGFRKCKHR